jgi:hypothetical protein
VRTLPLVLLLACTPDADVKTPVEPSDTDTDTDSDTDTDTDSDTDADTVVAPETEGTLANTFTLDAEGAGERRLDGVTLLDSAGTLTLSGRDHLAVAYQDHDWQSAGYHLYDVLSVAEDGSNLAITYLYCQGEDMPYAYTESFSHPMDWEVSEGVCTGRAQASDATVSLPALRALPPAFDPGVRIDGDDVSWDGERGQVTLGGVERALHPFNTVDCTDCPGGPWLEVHAMLVGDDACFGILYLFPEEPSYVQVSYTMCLPTLARPEGTLSADWTGTVGAVARPAGLVRPPPERLVRPER